MADKPLNILYLATDAYGGYGGIALYNRDVIEAMCADPRVAKVVSPPRAQSGPLGAMPAKLTYDVSAVAGNTAYLRAVLRHARVERYDLVYCAHINLAPVAWAISRARRIPWMLCIYGIDAWPANASSRRRFFASRADLVTGVSQVTLDRFQSWCPIDPAKCVVRPNAIHLDEFGIAPRNPALEARYGLAGKKVIMTFGRLDPREAYKGFDEIIELLPSLIAARPEIAYLIAGAGKDDARLKAKASALGVGDRVVFTGMIDEAEKADHYRLADVYAMPSRGEGFGYVFLEAMACGVPAIASNQDGGQEAVRGGMIGQVVDPGDPAAIRAAILRAIDQPKAIPAGLEYFALPAFRKRVQATIRQVAG